MHDAHHKEPRLHVDRASMSQQRHDYRGGSIGLMPPGLGTRKPVPHEEWEDERQRQTLGRHRWTS